MSDLNKLAEERYKSTDGYPCSPFTFCQRAAFLAALSSLPSVDDATVTLHPTIKGNTNFYVFTHSELTAFIKYCQTPK